MQHQVANDILIPEIDQLLREGHEVRFTPTGVSMRPYIEGGRDSVILRSLTRPPRRGDILLARVSDIKHQTYVLHRVEKIDPQIILRGDGNIRGTETILPEDILGIVVRIERPNGRRKPLTRGRLWPRSPRLRHYLLKIYRHTFLKWCYD